MLLRKPLGEARLIEPDHFFGESMTEWQPSVIAIQPPQAYAELLRRFGRCEELIIWTIVSAREIAGLMKQPCQ